MRNTPRLRVCVRCLAFTASSRPADSILAALARASVVRIVEECPLAARPNSGGGGGGLGELWGCVTSRHRVRARNAGAGCSLISGTARQAWSGCGVGKPSRTLKRVLVDDAGDAVADEAGDAVAFHGVDDQASALDQG